MANRTLVEGLAAQVKTKLAELLEAAVVGRAGEAVAEVAAGEAQGPDIVA
ncbi:hypothetical protein [Nocardia terpenica]|nr:hypothetical protein [Nocardia terpenica]